MQATTLSPTTRARMYSVGLSDVFLNEDCPGHQQTLNEVADLEGGVAKKHAVAGYQQVTLTTTGRPPTVSAACSTSRMSRT